MVEYIHVKNRWVFWTASASSFCLFIEFLYTGFLVEVDIIQLIFSLSQLFL